VTDSPQIFVSIGRPLNESQREFKRSLLNIVKTQGFSPRTVGRETEDTDVPSARAVDQIRKILSKCDGAVVVAYERNKADNMSFNSVSNDSKSEAGVRLPTAWNHAEAAMAYYSDLPMLLLREKGVWTDSFLVDGVLGAVGDIEIGPGAFVTHDFLGQLQSWVEDVHDRRKSGARRPLSGLDAEVITLRDLGAIFAGMNWKTSLIFFSMITALVGFVFSLGLWVAHIK